MRINHGYFQMLCMNHKAPTNYLTQGGKRNSKYGTANFWAGFKMAAKHSEFTSIARAVYNKFGPTDAPVVPKLGFATNNTPQATKVVLFCLGAIQDFHASDPVCSAVRFGLDYLAYGLFTMFVEQRNESSCSYQPLRDAEKTVDPLGCYQYRYEDCRDDQNWSIPKVAMQLLVHTVGCIAEKVFENDEAKKKEYKKSINFVKGTLPSPKMRCPGTVPKLTSGLLPKRSSNSLRHQVGPFLFRVSTTPIPLQPQAKV